VLAVGLPRNVGAVHSAADIPDTTPTGETLLDLADLLWSGLTRHELWAQHVDDALTGLATIRQARRHKAIHRTARRAHWRAAGSGESGRRMDYCPLVTVAWQQRRATTVATLGCAEQGGAKGRLMCFGSPGGGVHPALVFQTGGRPISGIETPRPCWRRVQTRRFQPAQRYGISARVTR